MRVHVLTAVTRPRNLPLLAASIAKAQEQAPPIQIVWHWQMDPRHEHVGGQAPKNQMLDQITDGWVYILDDDTLMHPDLLARVHDTQWADALVVTQSRRDGSTLYAAPENVKVGHIDIGQAVIRRDMIGDELIPETYDGDGHFLDRVLHQRGYTVAYTTETLSYHNWL